MTALPQIKRRRGSAQMVSFLWDLILIWDYRDLPIQLPKLNVAIHGQPLSILNGLAVVSANQWNHAVKAAIGVKQVNAIVGHNAPHTK
jgi:hypothetical protein